MNNVLTILFTKLDMEETIEKMHPIKAPNPNGMPALFYQKYWNILKDDVTKFFLEVLNNNESLKGSNNTIISLIPKMKEPNKVTEFRPISLYNILYKIIAKSLTNKMKGMLLDIISKSESAFILGRLILDLWLLLKFSLY